MGEAIRGTEENGGLVNEDSIAVHKWISRSRPMIPFVCIYSIDLSHLHCISIRWILCSDSPLFDVAFTGSNRNNQLVRLQADLQILQDLWSARLFPSWHTFMRRSWWGKRPTSSSQRLRYRFDILTFRSRCPEQRNETPVSTSLLPRVRWQEIITNSIDNVNTYLGASVNPYSNAHRVPVSRSITCPLSLH